MEGVGLKAVMKEPQFSRKCKSHLLLEARGWELHREFQGKDNN